MALENYIDEAWKIVTESLCSKEVFYNEADLNHAMQSLQEEGLAEVIEEWFFQNVQHHLRCTVAPKFWLHFTEPIKEDDVIQHMETVTNELYQELSAYEPCTHRLALMRGYIEESSLECNELISKQQRKTLGNLILFYKAIIFPKANKHFQNAVDQFYHRAFKAFDANSKTSMDLDDSDLDDDSLSLSCPGCDTQRESCQCEHIQQVHSQVNTQLRELGLLDRISGDAVNSLINQRIRHHVSHTCKGNFETKYLETLDQWLETKVVGWLELLYGHHTSLSIDGNAVSPIKAHKGRLYHFMYDIYSRIRIQQLFNIIIEFPDSKPALLDLKTCLERTNLRGILVQSLKHALETRLLHPGVNTNDILTAYVSAIKALRVLDPTGVLLDLVCEPVRRYLRNRDDTVRCIVTSLTEEQGSIELSDELTKGQPLILDESYHSDEDGDDWQSWQPDPVDADPAKSASSRRTSDIISMLVNIYGSKELFVNEYRTLLADRILTNFNYATEKEIRYLELLKLRFGEAQLHLCEVMLKDVADSKRINTHIKEQRAKAQKEGGAAEAEPDAPDEVPLSAMILSAQFWPAFREEKVELPECLGKSMEKYTKSFEMLKGNRSLSWKPHLGLVEIEIELKDKTLNMNVSPVHAAIIWHFQRKGDWMIEDLSAEMKMPAHALRRKIAFWQSHGLLKEEAADEFVLVEEHRGRTQDTMMIEEDEAESAMASAQDQKEEELQVIWSYVVGMLTNLASLPLDRIHSMLKMFAMQGPGSECTIHELKAFLDRKVKEQKLIHSGREYKLPKPGS